ncbi:hypothetical protein [Paenibacillus sabinae]|uniref:Uncharacterized protein n=1 Tax=Paenibacillus sabinae T27 TaxID=1268072 RepID=X4ZXZ0_9BACL|nr:hypothetical protein [Paenibacillus sabinae]AHV97068.1 hypothetical protein PSAB_10690 [Paenibacillus sabinae T27]
MMKELPECKRGSTGGQEAPNSKAPLHTKNGLRNNRYLTLLVMTEMQLEQLQDNEKGRFAERPR